MAVLTWIFWTRLIAAANQQLLDFLPDQKVSEIIPASFEDQIRGSKTGPFKHRLCPVGLQNFDEMTVSSATTPPCSILAVLR
jgi:hypothetical protein